MEKSKFITGGNNNMNDEEKVVAEQAEEKVPFLKRPLVRKIGKYALIALFTGITGAVGYYAGYKHGIKSLQGTEASLEAIDTIVE